MTAFVGEALAGSVSVHDALDEIPEVPFFDHV